MSNDTHFHDLFGRKANDTLNSILSKLNELQSFIITVGPKRINKKELFLTISNILSDNTIFLIKRGNDIEAIRTIIHATLKCCKPLCYEKHPTLNIVYVEIIYTKLLDIACDDLIAIQMITRSRQRAKSNIKIKDFKKVLQPLAIFAFIVLLIYCIVRLYPTSTKTTTASSSDKVLINGNLDSTFIKENDVTKVIKKTDIQQLNKLTPEDKLKKEKATLIEDGWSKQIIKNGQFSSCYNFNPKFGKNDCYLQVQVGGGTDIAIKVMEVISEICIRYVYINSGTTYKIRRIPEGKYYLKIAYGKNWMSKVINGQCVGKFIQNPLYEKGQNIMDCDIKYYDDGSYSVPYFNLSLDVIASDISNSFNSDKISESDFNL